MTWTVCVCVCVISFTTIRPWALISLLSQLDAAAPESSYPLGDKPVNQPALFQTLVGHSVIVVRHVLFCSVVLSVNLYSGDLWEFHPPRPLVTDLRNQRHQRPFKVPLWPGDLPCRFCVEHCVQLLIYRPRRDDRLRWASGKSEKLISNQQPLGIEPGSPT